MHLRPAFWQTHKCNINQEGEKTKINSRESVRKDTSLFTGRDTMKASEKHKLRKQLVLLTLHLFSVSHPYADTLSSKWLRHFIGCQLLGNVSAFSPTTAEVKSQAVNQPFFRSRSAWQKRVFTSLKGHFTPWFLSVSCCSETLREDVFVQGRHEWTSSQRHCPELLREMPRGLTNTCWPVTPAGWAERWMTWASA